MQEVSFCGRTGEIEDREPVLVSGEFWLLRCPDCGHLDDLRWLSEEAGLMVWGEARRRRGEAIETGRNGKALSILKYLLASGPRHASQDYQRKENT